MTFSIHRGTNISHWLSQSKRRGEARRAWFKEEDVRRIAEWGFDHVRIPIDEVQMWDEEGEPDGEAFVLLNSALDWCADYDLKAIVDLHILRAHYFNDRTGVPPLFTDPAVEEHFADLWRSLSDHLHDRPLDMVAYELLNEAVAEDPEDWNRVAMTAFSAVRELEPERTIVLGSNEWNHPSMFEHLTVPEDENCVLTFHFYYPMLVTHYTAPWTPAGDYDGPIDYPGTLVPPERLEDVQNEIEDQVYTVYDRDAMVEQLKEPLKTQDETGLPLYCGEFGCYHKTPQPVRVAWYRDIIDVFSEFDVAWANWDYKGGFGLVTPDGEEDGGVLEILLS